MGLNNIKLSFLAIGELYKDALVYPASGPVTAPAADPPAPAPASSVHPPAPASSVHPSSSASPSSAHPSSPAPAGTPVPTPTLYKFLGDNRRATTILVHSPGTAYLPDDQLSFLSKMLLACQMTLADIAIVNAATQPVLIATLRQQLHPKAVLLFGLEPVQINLPINFPIFRLQPYDDCTYLAAPPLHLLVGQSEESRLLKSKLWVCLKSLFDV
jgi:hypothetical protein